MVFIGDSTTRRQAPLAMFVVHRFVVVVEDLILDLVIDERP